MELKTELQEGCLHAVGYCIDHTDVCSREVKNLEHDALAAHALMQAMETLRTEFLSAGITGSVGCAIVWEVQSRAEELMQEWTR